MKICDPDSVDGVQLPQPQTELPCGECTDGAYRNPTTSACDYCPDGRYSNSSTYGECMTCPVGTAATKTFAVTQVFKRNKESKEGSYTTPSPRLMP